MKKQFILWSLLIIYLCISFTLFFEVKTLFIQDKKILLDISYFDNNQTKFYGNLNKKEFLLTKEYSCKETKSFYPLNNNFLKLVRKNNSLDIFILPKNYFIIYKKDCFIKKFICEQ